MNVECLLDTNVLAYAFSKIPDDEARRKRAEEIMRGHRYGISAQVLAELYVVLTRKAKQSLLQKDAQIVIENFQGTPCVPIDTALVIEGINISRRWQISYWDGAIIAAAKRLGAAMVYSEDLNSGQLYDGIRVINPFKSL